MVPERTQVALLPQSLPAFLGLPCLPIYLATSEGPAEPETLEAQPLPLPSWDNFRGSHPQTLPGFKVISVGNDLGNRRASEAGRVWRSTVPRYSVQSQPLLMCSRLNSRTLWALVSFSETGGPDATLSGI